MAVCLAPMPPRHYAGLHGHEAFGAEHAPLMNDVGPERDDQKKGQYPSDMTKISEVFSVELMEKLPPVIVHVTQTVVVNKAQARMLNTFLQSYNIRAMNRIDATICTAMMVLMKRHSGRFSPIMHAKIVKSPS